MNLRRDAGKHRDLPLYGFGLRVCWAGIRYALVAIKTPEPAAVTGRDCCGCTVLVLMQTCQRWAALGIPIWSES
jgi:hypothetical protein